ncbi:Aminopeptidase M1 isoform D [Glycine soja]|uniref:Aminopeptidase M1 isoform C n=1 Tax=Glycine soja TaxID=3848 RepID=A0A445GCB8_GLYSO|nr:Aminopeptidase M1 isoform C [Glycine soja]RZB58907.1 Aminopeptidase M1 isoform D [Glycine soja]
MEQKQQSIDQFKGNTRLPSFAIPERYELHLIPDLSALLLFDETLSGGVLRIGFSGILNEHLRGFYKWVDCKADNWERILVKYGAGLLLTNFISQIVPLVNSDEKADEIEAFFASHMNHSIVMHLKLSIERIRIKARWI